MTPLRPAIRCFWDGLIVKLTRAAHQRVAPGPSTPTRDEEGHLRRGSSGVGIGDRDRNLVPVLEREVIRRNQTRAREQEAACGEGVLADQP